MDNEEYLTNCSTCIERIQKRQFPLTEEENRDYNLLRYAYQCYKDHNGELISDFRKAKKLLDELELIPHGPGFHPHLNKNPSAKIDLTDVFKRWL